MVAKILGLFIAAFADAAMAWLKARQASQKDHDIGRVMAELDAAVRGKEVADAMAQADLDGRSDDVAKRLRDGRF
ncbi:hypothetical protein [Consotaella salsifontis]|uniref:Phage shock protein B n=1 Tax=Consotaella salsifontis TaxID=1365950 RepID=A0A1T4SRZ0_9HYPH|nr:hypothetical protein [Consotaella salsifontis]SKA30933.1 hypothetical protein SAMN05428963_11387 [Consotaella salsifontis]